MSDHHPASLAERPIERIRRPIDRVIHLENISGFALIGGAVLALVLANSLWSESVAHFWHQHLVVSVGPWVVDESLVHWVNDALMAIFFFVACLEIKRELVAGDLRNPRKAALPVVAAIGGMVVPALLFVLVAGSEARSGWGVPMATDIAFAVGVLTLLGDRVPSKLKMLLLTLAIVDDLGAIIVIAVFYTASLNVTALMVGVGIVGAMVVLRALGVWWMPIYVLAGTALWFALFESGVHATLAGVICGLLAPAKPRRPHETSAVAAEHLTVEELKSIVFDTRESRSVVDRLIHGIHPFSALLIVPIFAMANTGVPVSLGAITASAGSSASQAIAVGLVVGKPLGITLAAFLAVKGGLASLPDGITWRHMIGLGCLGGIGFTVSLFITELAFTSETIVDEAKLSVLAGSVAAATLGVLILRGAGNIQTDPGPISFRELDATLPASLVAPVAAERVHTN